MRLPMIHLLALLMAAAAGSSAAAEERRVALVIGNGDYANTADLPNPPNDGRRVAEALRALGFEVLSGVDLDYQGMQDIIRLYARTLRGADVGLFFYAGHGLQVNGRNYIVPTDALLEDEADLPFETLNVSVVLEQMEREPRTNLVFLDACRDNPLARTLARSMGTRSTAIGRGLARINAGLGTLIAYATEPDNVALDGQGENSPFTKALLNHIDTPGLEVRQMLTRVRMDVISETQGQQVPWDHSSLVSEFFFEVPAAAEEPEVAAVPDQPAADDAMDRPPRGQVDPSLERVFWETIQSSGDPRDFELYLEQFPDGVFAGLARYRLASLEQTRGEPTEQPPANQSEAGLPGNGGTSGQEASGTLDDGPVVETSEPGYEAPESETLREAEEVAALPDTPPVEDHSAAESALRLSSTQRVEVQRALRVLGFNPRGIDGVFGPNTRAAISAFQGARNLPVTGYLSAAVYGDLMDEAREPLEREQERARAEAAARPPSTPSTTTPSTSTPSSGTRPVVGASARPPSGGENCRTEVTRIAGPTLTRPILVPRRRTLAISRTAALSECRQVIRAALNQCRSIGGEVIGSPPECECVNAGVQQFECEVSRGSYSLTCEYEGEPEVFRREICD